MKPNLAILYAKHLFKNILKTLNVCCGSEDFFIVAKTKNQTEHWYTASNHTARYLLLKKFSSKNQTRRNSVMIPSHTLQ